jgi:hypothetical protein
LFLNYFLERQFCSVVNYICNFENIGPRRLSHGEVFLLFFIECHILFPFKASECSFFADAESTYREFEMIFLSSFLLLNFWNSNWAERCVFNR